MLCVTSWLRHLLAFISSVFLLMHCLLVEQPIRVTSSTYGLSHWFNMFKCPKSRQCVQLVGMVENKLQNWAEKWSAMAWHWLTADCQLGAGLIFKCCIINLCSVLSISYSLNKSYPTWKKGFWLELLISIWNVISIQSLVGEVTWSSVLLVCMGRCGKFYWSLSL